MKQIKKTFLLFILMATFLTACYGNDIPQVFDSGTAESITGTGLATATASTEKDAKPKGDASAATQGNTDAHQSVASPIKPGQLLKTHFLDVGQADCILVELPNNEKMLIDAGNNEDKDTILGYLDSQGIKKLDYVIATHPHEDHIGSLDEVIKKYDVGSIYMPKVSSNTKSFEDVLTTIKNKGLKVKAPESGSYLFNINNTENKLIARFLAPNKSKYEDVNNYSIVLKITFGNTSMLFMGDAGALSESEIINAGYDIKSNLIKIGHHGSAYSSSDNFIKLVQPQYAIISVGKNNDYGHPAQSTINRLQNAGIKIYRTDELGSIIAVSDGNTITIDEKVSPIKEQAPPAVSKQSASDSNQDIIVFVTKTGTKYHADGCRSLSKSKIPIKLSEAKAKGYTPCKICNPPQ